MVKFTHNNKEVIFSTREFRKMILLLKDLEKEASPLSKDEKEICRKIIKTYDDGCIHNVGMVVEDEKTKISKFICKICGFIKD